MWATAECCDAFRGVDGAGADEGVVFAGWCVVERWGVLRHRDDAEAGVCLGAGLAVRAVAAVGVATAGATTGRGGLGWLLWPAAGECADVCDGVDGVCGEAELVLGAVDALGFEGGEDVRGAVCWHSTHPSRAWGGLGGR